MRWVFSKRKKYARYAKSIKDLTAGIEADSRWRYIGKSFVQLSDYAYEPTTEEITFNRNEVKLICNNVVSAHKNNREKDFVKRFDVALLRIAELKTKKGMLEFDAYEKQLRRDATLAYQVPKYSDPLKEAQEAAEVQKETEEFLQVFGVKGIAALINYLNSLADAKRPLDMYSRINSLKMSTDKKILFLKWLSRYSTGGEQLLLCYNYDDKKASVEERQKAIRAHI